MIPTDFWSFVVVSMLIIVVPGPDMALIAKNTVAGGRQQGFETLAGTIVGLSVHGVAAMLGLSAIIAASAQAFQVVKIIGAIYLVWLGAQSIWSAWSRRAADREDVSAQASTKGRGAFTQGVLTNVLNPKLAVFFLTFVPQFVDSGGSQTAQLALLTGTFLVLGAIWLAFYIVVMGTLAGVLNRPTVKRWFNTVVGAVLVLLGLRLIVEDA